MKNTSHRALIESLESRTLFAADPNLVAWYKLDDGAGLSAIDASGLGNTGTLVNGPVWTNSGKVNSALQLDGTNDSVLVNNSARLNPTAAITLAAWIKPDQWGGNRRILQKGNTDNQYRLTAEKGVLKFNIAGLSAATLSTALPETGQWSHVAATYDGAKMSIYINGVLAAQQNSTGAIRTTTNPLQLGAKNGSTTAGDYFDGTLDDVRVYDRSLAAAEVAALVNGQPPVNVAPTVNAGADQSITLPNSSVNLAGIVTDDNLPNPPASTTKAWTAQSVPAGGTVVFGTPAAASTTATFNIAGTYILRLTASDGALSSFDDVKVTVAPAPGGGDPTLVTWLKLDDASGPSAADASGYGHSGALTNGPTWTTGQLAGGLKFDGTNDYLQIANPTAAELNPTSAISLAAWINPSSWGSNRRIIQKGATDNQYRLTAENGVLKFHIAGLSAATLTVALPAVGKWTHVAATYDGAKMSIYVNGVLAAQQNSTGVIKVTADELAIGRKPGSTLAGNYFAGVMDDVRIYSRAITASEVADLAKVGTPTLTDALNHALVFAQAQLKQTMTDLANNTSKFVNRTSKSTGLWVQVGATDWTSGFLGGAMWQQFAATGDAYWSGKATAWTAPLAGQATAQTEDLYFRLMTTFLPLYQQTGNAAYRQVLLDAAESKNSQWNETVGAFETTWRKSSSGNPAANYAVLMDQTTDMLLMLWAAKETNNQVYYDRAVRHTRNVIAHLVRADGSSYQFGYFDKATGNFIDGETSQGYANESTWSRGQAWGVFALTAVARETGLADILAGAQKVANWYIAHLPADSVPYWDFDDPAKNLRDSSAAAIAASGLLDLTTLVTNATDKATYRTAAEKALTSLSSTAYLADGSNSHGILLHGTQNHPNTPAGDDVSLIFGDYFFLQAINRYKALPVA